MGISVIFSFKRSSDEANATTSFVAKIEPIVPDGAVPIPNPLNSPVPLALIFNEDVMLPVITKDPVILADPEYGKSVTPVNNVPSPSKDPLNEPEPSLANVDICEIEALIEVLESLANRAYEDVASALNKVDIAATEALSDVLEFEARSAYEDVASALNVVARVATEELSEVPVISPKNEPVNDPV